MKINTENKPLKCAGKVQLLDDRTGKPILDAFISASESFAEPKAAHSPLPWHLKRIGEQLYIEHEHGFVADMQRDETVHYLDQAGELQELEANAALIVRSVNNATKLAEALRLAIDWHRHGQTVMTKREIENALASSLAEYEGNAQ